VGQEDPLVPAIVVTGAPAAGKSVLGAAVARQLGAALLDMDTVTGPLVAVVAELCGTDDLDSTRLAELTRSARYRTMLDTAAEILSIGTPVVLVAPFTAERRSVDRWQELSDRLAGAGGTPRLVWVRLPAEEILRRMRTRDADRDRRKLDDPQRFLAGLTLAPPAAPHVAVDGALPLPDQVKAALNPSG
jgi:predicted kinase